MRSRPKLSLESFNVDNAAPECLNGHAFVFSGILEGISRENAQEMVKELGGRVTTAVSSKTDYLVVGKILEDGRNYQEGSKYKKAMEHGTRVVVGAQALYGLFEQYDEQAKGSQPTVASVQKSAAAPKVVANPYTAAVKPANPYATKPIVSNP